VADSGGGKGGICPPPNPFFISIFILKILKEDLQSKI
jgi:hypothetical protein